MCYDEKRHYLLCNHTEPKGFLKCDEEQCYTVNENITYDVPETKCVACRVEEAANEAEQEEGDAQQKKVSIWKGKGKGKAKETE